MASHKVKLEVEVEVEGNPQGKPEDFVFLNVKVGTNPSCPLPPDAPAPRRFVKDLALAAGTKIAKG